MFSSMLDILVAYDQPLSNIQTESNMELHDSKYCFLEMTVNTYLFYYNQSILGKGIIGSNFGAFTSVNYRLFVSWEVLIDILPIGGQLLGY